MEGSQPYWLAEAFQVLPLPLALASNAAEVAQIMTCQLLWVLDSRQAGGLSTSATVSTHATSSCKLSKAATGA